MQYRENAVPESNVAFEIQHADHHFTYAQYHHYRPLSSALHN